MIIVYKVLTRDNCSAFRRFKEGGIAYNTVGQRMVFSGGWGALAFVSLEYAKKWVEYMKMGEPLTLKIQTASAELMSLPPMAESVNNYSINKLQKDLYTLPDTPPHGSTTVCLGSWPPGTVMCREITLLGEVK